MGSQGGNDAGDLVAKCQRQQGWILPRTDVLEVGRVHACGSYLDRHLARTGRVEFDHPLVEDLGPSEIGCHPLHRHDVFLRAGQVNFPDGVSASVLITSLEATYLEYTVREASSGENDRLGIIPRSAARAPP